MKSPGLFLCFFIIAVSALSAQTEAVVRTTIQKIGGENPPARLTLISDIPKTEVYLHGSYEGFAPFNLDPAPPGFIKFSLIRNGYYSEAITVEAVLGEHATIRVELRPKTGTVSVENAPNTASFYLPGISSYIPGDPLSEGEHALRIEAFGYISKTVPVIVLHERNTPVDGTLEPAPFILLSFKPEERAYNPESTVPLSLLVAASAPGTAHIIIKNSEGYVVRTLNSEVFTAHTTRVLWDGKNNAGSDLPDGLYTATLEATQPAKSNKTDIAERDHDATTSQPPLSVLTKTTQIYLDRSVVYRYTSIFSGTGATGPVVSASRLPPAAMAVSIFSDISKDSFSPGVSFLAGITKYFEAGVMVCVPVENDGNVDIDYALSIKTGFSSNAHNGAFQLGYRRSQGITAGPAYEFRLGPISAGAHAEVIIKDNGGILYKPDVYAGAGVALRAFYGPLGFGGWFRIETSRIGSDFIFDETLSAGLTGKWFIPSSDLFVGAEASMHWNDSLKKALYSGTAGFGLFF